MPRAKIAIVMWTGPAVLDGLRNLLLLGGSEVIGESEDSMTLIRALDQVEAGLAFFNQSGDPLCRNEPFLRLISQSVDLLPVVQQLVEESLAQVGTGWDRSLRVQQLAWRRVKLGRLNLQLRSSHIGFDLCGTGACLLITVEPVKDTGAPLSEVLQRRFGLTPVQSRVTLLLAEGDSNEEIATKLWISPHTARNHTKAVLQKLQVSRRTQIAALLQRLQR